MLDNTPCWVFEEFTIRILGQIIHSHRADHHNDLDLSKNMMHQPMDYLKKWIEESKIRIPECGITYEYYRNLVLMGNYGVGSERKVYTVYDMFSISFGNGNSRKVQDLYYATTNEDEYRTSHSSEWKKKAPTTEKEWLIVYDEECGATPLLQKYSEEDEDLDRSTEEDEDLDRSTDDEGPGLGFPSDRQWMTYGQCKILNDLAMARFNVEYAEYN